MTSRSALGARLSVLYAVQFAYLGIHAPFFPMWLSSRGLPADTVGLVLALPIVIRATSAYAVAGLADRRIGALKLLGLLGATSAAVWMILLRFDQLPVIVAVTALTAVLTAALVPLTDTVTLDAAGGHDRMYGRVRIWGSVGFLAAMLAGGQAIVMLGAGAVPAMLAGLSATAALYAFLSPSLAAASEQRRRRAAETAVEPLPRRFLWAAGGIACIHASHSVINAFAPILWTKAGFDALTVGIFLGVGVVAEIALLMRFGRTGFGAPVFGILTLGAAAGVLRWALMATGPGALATSALQVLHALSFGATLIGSIAAVSNLVPEGERARAQGLIAATTAGISAAGTATSGQFVEALGFGTFALMVPLALLALVMIRIAAATTGDQPQSAGEGGKTTLSS